MPLTQETSTIDQAGEGGTLCISLDFELMWGAKEKWTTDSYGRHVLGVREVVPRLLNLFATYDVHATWATVGMIFCGSKDELMSYLPDLRPSYDDPQLSSYAYVEAIGRDEAGDPLHYGASLVDRVAEAPGQEIATHTFSHFYALEKGATIDQFDADLGAADRIAADRGLSLSSIVFPRNQYSDAHLDVCAAHGLTSFRGNRNSWLYRPSNSQEAGGALRRVGRLADNYVPVTDWSVSAEETAHGIVNVPASSFLRPFSPALSAFDRARLARTVGAMRQACRRRQIFHLWWHPHNFGGDIERNFAFLTSVLGEFARLRDDAGMRSLTMRGIAQSSGLDT